MSGALRLFGPAAGAHALRARRLGVDTQYEAVVFMHKECPVCRSEGFVAHNRLLLRAGDRHVIATLYQIASDLIAHDEAALSESAWNRLQLQDGDIIAVSHPDPLNSLSHVRSRIYGNRLSENALQAIMGDIVDGKYSDIHLSSFLTACASPPLDHGEVLSLTKAMVEAGDRLSWKADVIVDKHSVGGLPGNRTTPIIVPIVAALGLTMPKTSSRAITSPAGTADTMETMAPVELSAAAIQRVVEQEGGCIAWGGAVKLSPADDILIRIERALDLDCGRPDDRLDTVQKDRRRVEPSHSRCSGWSNREGPQPTSRRRLVRWACRRCRRLWHKGEGQHWRWQPANRPWHRARARSKGCSRGSARCADGAA